VTALTTGVIATATALGLGALLVDQATKAAARDRLQPGGRPVEIVPGVVDLRLAKNSGINFGMGQGLGGIFSIASAIAVPAIGAYLLHSGAHPLLTAAGTGIAMGGTLGNLSDRFANDGSVTDFIGTPLGICNVADVLLFGGLATMGAAMFVQHA
jgi:signal peptidase II